MFDKMMTDNEFILSSLSNHRDEVLNNVVSYVFHLESSRSAVLDNITPTLPSYGNIKYLVKSTLDEIENHIKKPLLDGRIGPNKVSFDKNSCYGSFSFADLPLEITSRSSFSTIKANVCVFKGKWQYEVLLGTKGVMQIGWATQECVFSEEKGVGDTINSYSYDGNRQRAWNVTSRKYGDVWQNGDVISCCIDLDRRESTYFRNGNPLGAAFDDLNIGPGIAYFPAFSLGSKEQFSVNFGSMPFKHPQPGYSPLEAHDIKSLTLANRCFVWMLRIINLHFHLKRIHFEDSIKYLAEESLLITSQQVCSRLGPLLGIPFVTECSLIPVLKNLTGLHSALNEGNKNILKRIDIEKIQVLFKYLVASLEDHELKQCIENVIFNLLTQYKQVSKSLKFENKIESLVLLYCILSDPSIRKYSLQYVLFDKVVCFVFVAIKPIENIEKIIPEVYWQTKDGSYSYGNSDSYKAKIDGIKSAVTDLKELQVSILELLMTVEEENNYSTSTRKLFLTKLKSFIKECSNVIHGRPISKMHLYLCLFQRLMVLLKRIWDKEIIEPDMHIPSHLYYNETFSFYDSDVQRVGGLESHLKKTLEKEIRDSLSRVYKNQRENLINNGRPYEIVRGSIISSQPSTSYMADADNFDSDLGFGEIKEIIKNKNESHHRDLRLSLYELLDSIISLYHVGVHSQIIKTNHQVETIYVYAEHVSQNEKKLEYAVQKNYSEKTKSSIQKSSDCIKNTLLTSCRQHAWRLATSFSDNCRQLLCSLCLILLKTLNKASQEGQLFGFIPSFYLDTFVELSTSIRHYIQPSDPSSSEHQRILSAIGEFLALHFCDTRIVYTEIKESLARSLCGFVVNKISLTALENISLYGRKQMITNLLLPNEKSSSAQSYWILVRFWKGYGYAFRFNRYPDLVQRLGPKPAVAEHSLSYPINAAPCPSKIFQNHIVEVLNEMPELRSSFFVSLFDQFNWVFSELIGMLQEIRNASNRPERVFIDSTQLRKCATHFDLAVLHLRVLEMIITIAPQYFFNLNEPVCKLWLNRFCQLISQILNRVLSTNTAFSYVANLDIPGLETISHFPIITATLGIIVCILREGDTGFSRERAVILLREPSFKISYLKSVIKPESDVENQSEEGMDPVNSNEGANNVSHLNESFIKPFYLNNFRNEISQKEIKDINEIRNYLDNLSMNMSDTEEHDDRTLCTICYDLPSNCTFEPCLHTSCRNCITRYLMTQKECFFCKVNITKVIDSNTNEVIFNANENVAV